MKAYYASKADAIGIELVPVDRIDEDYAVHDTYCHVGRLDGQPFTIEFLGTPEALEYVEEAAKVTGVNPQLLVAVTKAVLAAPDRDITFEFDDPFYENESLVA